METLWSWLDSHKEALENSLVQRILNGKDASTSSSSGMLDLSKPEPAPRPAQSVRVCPPSGYNWPGGTVQIEVCNPKLKTSELVPYILYRVNSWSSSADDPEKARVVFRRYSDFEWLRKQLLVKNPGIIVPPLPKEQGALFPVLEPGGLVNSGLLSAGLGSAALPSLEVLESRCAALGPFIAKVAVHPILRQTPELLLFLETTDDAKWAEVSPPWYDSSTIEAVVVDTVTGFLANIAGAATDEEAHVLDALTEPSGYLLVGEYLDKFQMDAAALEAALGRVGRAAQAQGETLRGMSALTSKLADIERRGSIALHGGARDGEPPPGVDWQPFGEALSSAVEPMQLMKATLDDVVAKELAEVQALSNSVRDVMALREECVATHNDLCRQIAAAEAAIRSARMEGHSVPPAAQEELRMVHGARDEMRRRHEDFRLRMPNELAHFHNETAELLRQVLLSLVAQQGAVAGREADALAAYCASLVPVPRALPSEQFSGSGAAGFIAAGGGFGNRASPAGGRNGSWVRLESPLGDKGDGSVHGAQAAGAGAAPAAPHGGYGCAGGGAGGAQTEAQTPSVGSLAYARGSARSLTNLAGLGVGGGRRGSSGEGEPGSPGTPSRDAYVSLASAGPQLAPRFFAVHPPGHPMLPEAEPFIQLKPVRSSAAFSEEGGTRSQRQSTNEGEGEDMAGPAAAAEAATGPPSWNPPWNRPAKGSAGSAAAAGVAAGTVVGDAEQVEVTDKVSLLASAGGQCRLPSASSSLSYSDRGSGEERQSGEDRKYFWDLPSPGAGSSAPGSASASPGTSSSDPAAAERANANSRLAPAMMPLPNARPRRRQSVSSVETTPDVRVAAASAAAGGESSPLKLQVPQKVGTSLVPASAAQSAPGQSHASGSRPAAPSNGQTFPTGTRPGFPDPAYAIAAASAAIAAAAAGAAPQAVGLPPRALSGASAGSSGVRSAASTPGTSPPETVGCWSGLAVTRALAAGVGIPALPALPAPPATHSTSTVEESKEEALTAKRRTLGFVRSNSRPLLAEDPPQEGRQGISAVPPKPPRASLDSPAGGGSGLAGARLAMSAESASQQQQQQQQQHFAFENGHDASPLGGVLAPRSSTAAKRAASNGRVWHATNSVRHSGNVNGGAGAGPPAAADGSAAAAAAGHPGAFSEAGASGAGALSVNRVGQASPLPTTTPAAPASPLPKLMPRVTLASGPLSPGGSNSAQDKLSAALDGNGRAGEGPTGDPTAAAGPAAGAVGAGKRLFIAAASASAAVSASASAAVSAAAAAAAARGSGAVREETHPVSAGAPEGSAVRTSSARQQRVYR